MCEDYKSLSGIDDWQVVPLRIIRRNLADKVFRHLDGKSVDIAPTNISFHLQIANQLKSAPVYKPVYHHLVAVSEVDFVVDGVNIGVVLSSIVGIKVEDQPSAYVSIILAQLVRAWTVVQSTFIETYYYLTDLGTGVVLFHLRTEV